MRKLLFILSFFLLGEAEAQSGDAAVAGIELSTVSGKNVVFKDSDGLLVVIFLSPTCPLSQKYTLTLNALAKEFSDSVKFYGVFAEADPVADEYKEFKRKFEIRFDLLVDEKKQLVKALAASVTPEAFVLNRGKVVYRGAIDDWAIALGKTKKKAALNFVRNAIQCALAGTTPVPDYSKPVGCFID